MVLLSHLPMFPTYHDIPYYKKTKQNKQTKGTCISTLTSESEGGWTGGGFSGFPLPAFFWILALTFFVPLIAWGFCSLTLDFFSLSSFLDTSTAFSWIKISIFVCYHIGCFFLNFTFMVVHLMYYATRTNSCTWPYIPSMCYS